MNTLQAIAQRRSIRKFTQQKISQQQIDTLLKAAMLAPTARNCQEWEFVVVREEKILQSLMQAHPHAQMLATASCAIVVCGNTKREYAPGYWIGDCAAATQNILLAATDLGLGSVWLGVYPNQERIKAISSIIHCPAEVLPFNIIALGYPAEEKPEVQRFDPAKIHLETW